MEKIQVAFHCNDHSIYKSSATQSYERVRFYPECGRFAVEREIPVNLLEAPFHYQTLSYDSGTKHTVAMGEDRP